MSATLDDSSGSFFSERRHPEIAELDPEERLDKVRQWALSLSLPRLARGAWPGNGGAGIPYQLLVMGTD
eukprot:s1379_g1.t1